MELICSQIRTFQKLTLAGSLWGTARTRKFTRLLEYGWRGADVNERARPSRSRRLLRRLLHASDHPKARGGQFVGIDPDRREFGVGTLSALAIWANEKMGDYGLRFVSYELRAKPPHADVAIRANRSFKMLQRVL